MTGATERRYSSEWYGDKEGARKTVVVTVVVVEVVEVMGENAKD